jgi:hypothetical protein
MNAVKAPLDKAKMSEYETISKESFKKVLDDPKKTWIHRMLKDFIGERTNIDV